MTLAACASASKPSPAPDAPAPNPVVRTLYETRLICPAEVMLEIPPAATPAADAVVRANPAGDAYLQAKDAREDLLADRLADAQAQCAAEADAP